MEEEGYQEMFKMFDKDASGLVSIDEFLFSVRVSSMIIMILKKELNE